MQNIPTVFIGTVLSITFCFFVFRDAQQYDCPQITTNSCHWEAVDGRDGFRAGMLYYMMVIVRNKKTGNETKSKLFKEDTKTLGMISLASFSTLLFYNGIEYVKNNVQLYVKMP